MSKTTVIRQCREHAGGRFESPIRRGRPPVRCAPEYPCTASETAIPKPQTHRSKSLGVTPAEHAAAIRADLVRNPIKRKAPESHVGATKGREASLRVAKDAKSLLEAQGWSATGKGWTEDGTYRVSVTAVRGEENFHAEWVDGQLAGPMQYSLWNAEKLSVNGAPSANLPFDVDEIPDARLVPYLAGMKLTWYNRLSRGMETAVVKSGTIEIMHAYDNEGEELPGDRTIRFVSRDSGYRAFRLSQLLKIGTAPTERTEDK